MQEILFEIRYFERGLSYYFERALKKLTLFFLSNSVPFKEQSYRKQTGPGTSDHSLSR